MFFLSLRFADSGELGNGTFSKCNNPLLHFHPSWLQSAVGSPRAPPEGGCAVTAATSADQGENVCNFSYGQPVCRMLFCANFLLQPVSTDGFFQKPVDIETARECAVPIMSVSRSFAAYIRTSNRFYSPLRHSSGMSSGTYVHGESP